MSAARSLRISSGLSQKPTASPARYAAPSAVVSLTAGRMHGHAQQISLELHQQIIHRRAPIDAQFSERDLGIRIHGFDDISHLEPYALFGGAGDVARLGSTAQPNQEAGRVRIPIGRSQADKCRHQHDSIGVFDTRRQLIDLGGMANQLQTIAQPLDNGSADEDAAFQRVFQLLIQAADERGDQSFLREHELGADILQQKAARTVGVLGVTGMYAELTEERGLLISGDACDLGRFQTKRSGHLADLLARPDHLGHHAFGNSKQLQQIRIPSVFADVVEHGAAKHWCGR